MFLLLLLPRFEQYEKEGVLSMHTAFSRDQARKIYVQDRILEAGAKVCNYMLKVRAGGKDTFERMRHGALKLNMSEDLHQ
eukprot:2926340-Amphidinium_carterae.2